MPKKKARNLANTNLGGRPTKYDPKMCDMVLDFMAGGASLMECAAYLKIARDTLYQWKSKHKEFAKALQMGKEWAEAKNAQLVKAIALGQVPKANVSAYQLYMRNTHGWDKNVNNSGVVNQTMNIGSIGQMNVLQDKSTDELIEYIQDLSQDVKGVIDVTDYQEVKADEPTEKE